jgi:crossover junction endodeoxyribonuclease RuvC
LKVLAIDPGLRKTGFAVVERNGRDHVAHTFGVIANPAGLRPSSCLVNIKEQLHDVVRRFAPACCAVESVIYVQSFKTAITLGAARGAAILAAAEQGMEVFEYPPKRVKQAVVGRGAADKQQVAFMVRALFGLTEFPPPDAADALAIGLAHLYATDPNKALQNEGSRV